MFKRITLSVITVLVIISCLSACNNNQKNDIVMEYNGFTINSDMYTYWLSYYKTALLQNYNNSEDTDEFWNLKLEDSKTVEQYAEEWAKDYVKTILIGMYLFNDNKLSISDELYSQIDGDIKEKIKSYGGESKLNSFLSDYNINIDTLHNIYVFEEMSNAAQEYLFFGNGMYAPTEKEIIKYYNDNYNCLILIPIYTSVEVNYDENGNCIYDSDGNVSFNTIDQEKQAKKQSLIEGICSLIENGSDVFSLQSEYSEMDLSAYDSGVFISSNEYGLYDYEFVKAAMNLNVGEYRKIEAEYLTYIVYKTQLPDYNKLTESDLDQLSGIYEYCTNEKYQSFMENSFKDIIIYNDKISEFSLRDAAVLPAGF